MPEWETVTIAPAVQRTDRRGTPVRIKAGVVRTNSGGRRLAMQLDDRPIVVLSPASASRIIGALLRGLRAM
jgi:hypothetical protein